MLFSAAALYVSLPYSYEYKLLPLLQVLIQADLMMALVAGIRDFLREFLSKSLSEKPIQHEISSFKS